MTHDWSLRRAELERDWNGAQVTTGLRALFGASRPDLRMGYNRADLVRTALAKMTVPVYDARAFFVRILVSELLSEAVGRERCCGVRCLLEARSVKVLWPLFLSALTAIICGAKALSYDAHFQQENNAVISARPERIRRA